MPRIVWRVIGLASMVLGVALIADGVSAFAFDLPMLSMWLIVLGAALVMATFKWLSLLLMIASVVAFVMIPVSWSGGSWGTWLLLSLSFGVLGLIGIATSDWGDTSASARSEAEIQSPTAADEFEGAITGTYSDAGTKKTCLSCGTDRPEGTRFCRSCGTPFGDGATPSPNSASEPSGIPVITSGTWIVGAEIAPGMYRVAGYWARLDSHQGIISNDNVHGSGLSLLKVMDSDSYIEISGEATSLINMPHVDPIASDIRGGTYLVGVDIAPGRYRVSGEGSLAYAERIDRNMNTIRNEANNGSVLIQIAPSDFAFKFSGLLSKI